MCTCMYIRNTRSLRQNASTTPEEKNNAAERGKGRDSSSSSRYSARSQNKQYFAARGIGDLYVARPIIGAAFESANFAIVCVYYERSRRKLRPLF